MQCDTCTTTFKNLREAKDHYATKHNVSNGYIKCCKSKFHYPSLVVDHVKKKHLNPTPKKIKEKTQSKQEKKEKIQRKRDTSSRTCNICLKIFKRKAFLPDHMKLHEKQEQLENTDEMKFLRENFDLTCDFCDKIFTGFHDARKHYKKQHNDDKGYLKYVKLFLFFFYNLAHCPLPDPF